MRFLVVPSSVPPRARTAPGRWARVAAVSAAFALGSAACGGGKTAGRPAAARTPAVERRGIAELVRNEAVRARAELRAERVAIVVLDPRSGITLGSYDDAPGAPIEPASTMKALTIALALDAGVVTPERVIDCGNGSRAYGEELLRDPAPHGALPVRELLAVSSNVGTSRVFDALGSARLAEGLARLHLAPPAGLTGAGLPATLIAIGFGFPVAPEALARAYGVFANDGVYAEPEPAGAAGTRAVSAETARRMLELLENAVSGANATGHAGALPGTRVAGKTGTSDANDAGKTGTSGANDVFANFVGILPVERPRYVVLVSVRVADPNASGKTVAAPLFARVAGRLLAQE